MKQLIIKNIKATNFKGFSNLEVNFTTDAVILGGMNGYGKTTIFDAIELLVTGQIKRMASYSDNLHNHKFVRSQANKPLVFDMDKEEVRIEATFIIDGSDITLCRCAKVNEMKNPVDFTPFKKLYIFNPEDKDYRQINYDENENVYFKCLTRDYSFLNYLSQEEATSFLKCKETDRSSVIQSLFDTKIFDEPMAKIKVITKKINDNLANLKQSSDLLLREIEQLKADKVDENETAQSFVSLTNNKSKWDTEIPELSHEEMYSFVKEGGVMDGLLYLCQNEKWYRQSNRNNAIHKLLNGESLHNIAFYTWISPKGIIINQYSKWKPVNDAIQRNITAETLESVMNQIEENVPNIINPEIVAEAKRLVYGFKTVYLSATRIQKNVTELLTARATLVEKTKNYGNDLKLSECPLCGADYDNADNLINTIELCKEKIEKCFSSLGDGLNAQFEIATRFIIEHIQNPVNEYFRSQEITEALLLEYKNLDINLIEKNIKLLEKLGVTINWQNNIDAIERIIKDELLIQVKEIPVDIDLALLQKMFASYYKVLEKSNFTIDNIKKKKEYLIHRWNLSTSKILERKLSENTIVDLKIKTLNHKKDRLKKLSTEITAKRNQYVSSIITDIQILFYIYTGRILQDSYFGRGLFLKPDLSKNRILFVSGDYENNDVDALYNMSSGQLVAVAISFLLSLNKLYSTSNILAIDDPVQTIDDINLWGLMETLRHDFKDSFIILSTHESNYGQLVDYKFRKIGIKSEYIDVARYHRSSGHFSD